MPRPSETKLMNAAAAWRAGEKRAVIAKRLGVSVSTLRKWARDNNWDISPECAAAPAGSTAFTRAVSLYDSLAAALEDSIRSLRASATRGAAAEGESSATSKTLLEQIRSHQKALQTVLDFQSRLLKENRSTRWSASGASADPTGALDLQAARDEVRRRLARLAADADA